MVNILKNVWVIVFSISSAIFGGGIALQKFIDRVDAADLKASHALQMGTTLRLDVRDELKEMSDDVKQMKNNQDEMFRFMIRWKREDQK